VLFGRPGLARLSAFICNQDSSSLSGVGCSQPTHDHTFTSSSRADLTAAERSRLVLPTRPLPMRREPEPCANVTYSQLPPIAPQVMAKDRNTWATTQGGLKPTT